jgi:transcriptional regulator with XRE-family HTH domain
MAWINLGSALDKRKWSMSEFARRLDIPYQNLSRVFKPGFDPKISTVLRWCEVLKCTPDELYDESLSAEKKCMPKPKATEEYIKGLNKILKRRGKPTIT